MADINLASARAICIKCGISDELAQEIVRTRRRCGAFHCAEDLWMVKGMSNVAVGVLTSMYHINNDHSTRRFTTKNVYPRICDKDTPTRSRKSDRSPSASKRERSRSTSRQGRSARKGESNDQKDLVSVAVVDVDGHEHGTLAKSVHMEPSPSGNKLYIKCEGIRKYRIMDTTAEETESVTETTASSNAKTNSGNIASKQYGTGEFKADPACLSRNRNLEQIRDDFSRTELKFWDRIEKSRRELETSVRHLQSPRGYQTANWVRSLPGNVEDYGQNSFLDPQPPNLPGTSKQYPPPTKRHHRHSHRHRKEKHRKKDGKGKEQGERRTENKQADVCIIL